MKKILTFITIFLSIFVIDVSALDYYDINITTSFQESIEFSDVPLINLVIYSEANNLEDDGAIIRDIVELNESNNYSTTLKETYINDQSKVFAMVNKDNLGKYNCQLEFIQNNDGVAQINIMVTRNIFEKQDIEIPKQILESIYGKTTSSTTSQGTTNIATDSITIEKPTTTSKVNDTIIGEKEKEEQKQQEKVQKRKKNNKITIALFTIISIIVVLGVVFVTVKIVNANK